MTEKLSATESSTSAIDDTLRRLSQGILPDCARVHRPVVRVLCGNITDRTLYTWIKEGKFPPPVNGDPRQGWLVGVLRKSQGDADASA